MMILSAIAAYSALTLQSGTMTLAGKIVPIVYPPSTVRQIPEDVKAWDGFKGANASGSDWPAVFEAPGNWTAVQQKIAELGAPDKSAPGWKAKIFILAHTDTLTKQSDSTLWNQSRQRLNSTQIDAVLRSLARTLEYTRAATNGAANWSFDVEIENDLILLPKESVQGWLAEYANARVNDGLFVAEDKAFRGPYQAVLFVSAEPSLPRRVADKVWSAYVGNGIDQPEGFGSEAAILKALGYAAYDNWTGLNVYRPVRGGIAGEWSPNWPTLFVPDIWRTLAQSGDLPLDQITRLYKSGEGPHGSQSGGVELPTSLNALSPNVSVSVVDDPDRGRVLKYSENSSARYGGFALPYSQIDLAKTPYLSFWVKSSSLDPLWLGIERSVKGVYYQPVQVPAAPENAWKQVVIDLRGTNTPTTGKLYVGSGIVGETRSQIGAIEYLLDDFELVATGEPTPLPLTSGAQIPTVAAELAKQTDGVAINGLLRAEPFAATDEAALIEMTHSPNSRVATLAVHRLAQLDTPGAKAEVLRLVSASPFEPVKQAAAEEVGKMGDAKSAPVLSRLFASRSWLTRLAGGQAVAALPGAEAAVISMTFLQEVNPHVRLGVTRSASTESPVVLKRLLWSTVNDPSDAVRVESAWRLIGSGNPVHRIEGYKAIRDDSVGVRLALLQRMTDQPAEGHRGALQVAVADLSPRVRAAALIALAKQPGKIEAAEISNTFEDRFPIVQMALLDLAKAKELALPANAVLSLKASIDPRVVERVQGMAS